MRARYAGGATREALRARSERLTELSVRNGRFLRLAHSGANAEEIDPPHRPKCKNIEDLHAGHTHRHTHGEMLEDYAFFGVTTVPDMC